MLACQFVTVDHASTAFFPPIDKTVRHSSSALPFRPRGICCSMSKSKSRLYGSESVFGPGSCMFPFLWSRWRLGFVVNLLYRRSVSEKPTAKNGYSLRDTATNFRQSRRGLQQACCASAVLLQVWSLASHPGAPYLACARNLHASRMAGVSFKGTLPLPRNVSHAIWHLLSVGLRSGT